MPGQPNNPLHGITLQLILESLVEKIGWEEMGDLVNIKCFQKEPSIKSSLKFLRRTPWARKEVEELYVKVSAGWRKEKAKPKNRFSKPRKPFKKPPEHEDGLDW